MTSPTSAHTNKPVRHNDCGFTLVEMLVVIGIMVLLVGIALPMILRARTQAGKTRTAMDMQAIATGLGAYKQDFGDYPRPDADGIGFVILGRALLGPDVAISATPPTKPISTTAGKPGAIGGNDPYYIQIKLAGIPNPTSPSGVNADWAALPVFTDGADGFGFRVRAGGGQVYGPYLDPGKVANLNGVLIDADSNPILYYAALPSRALVDGTNVKMLFAGIPIPNVVPALSIKARWDFNQNKPCNSSGTLLSLPNFQAMLGDTTNATGSATTGDGYLTSNETPRVEGDYFLWSAGGDLKYGPDATDKNSLKDMDDMFYSPTGK